MGKEGPQPGRRCCGLGCQGHVVAMWQDPGVLAPLLLPVRPFVAAPPPPSCLGEGRPKQAWGALQSPRGGARHYPCALSTSWRPEQQLGPIF